MCLAKTRGTRHGLSDNIWGRGLMSVMEPFKPSIRFVAFRHG
jgi:hypothetical protein